MLKRVESPELIEFPNDFQDCYSLKLESVIKNTKELLHLIEVTCQNAQEHVNEFECTLKMW